VIERITQFVTVGAPSKYGERIHPASSALLASKMTAGAASTAAVKPSSVVGPEVVEAFTALPGREV